MPNLSFPYCPAVRFVFLCFSWLLLRSEFKSAQIVGEMSCLQFFSAWWETGSDRNSILGRYSSKGLSDIILEDLSQMPYIMVLWVCRVVEMKIWGIHPFCFSIKTKRVSYDRNKLQKGRNTLSKQTYVKNALLEIFIFRFWKLYKIQFHSGITGIKVSLHVKILNGGPRLSFLMNFV